MPYNKYSNKRVVIDNIPFASKKEGARYTELKILEKGGEISHLSLQVPFQLRISGTLICKYVADFVYFEKEAQVIEDVKGHRTAIFQLKWKMMHVLYGDKYLLRLT